MIEERIIPAGKGIRCPKKYMTLTPKGVCWHWTANTAKTADADAHWKYWSTSAQYGAHYVLDENKIIHCAPDTELLWHAGGHSFNSTLIGVEMCVNGDWNKTYKKAVELGIELCKKYNFDPHKHFKRHYDCTRKNCPIMWTNFVENGEKAWENFKNDVAEGLKSKKPASEAKPHWADDMIESLYKLKIVSAKGASFRPNDAATRAETAALIMNTSYKLGQLKSIKDVTFKDVPYKGLEWATESILFAAKTGLISGYPNGKFEPAKPTTRAEFASIASLLLKKLGQEEPKPDKIYFKDISTHWAKEAIEYLALLGIVNNVDFFRPDDKITRAEAAAILYNILKINKKL